MSEFDWIDDSVEVKALAPVSASARKKKRTRSEELILAERALMPAQRAFLYLLIETPTMAAAHRRLRDAGYSFDRSTLWRWRKSYKFAHALELAKNYALEQLGVNQGKILLDAEKIKELALEPTPVLWRGKPTGYHERELGTALQALELQRKAAGIGGDSAQAVQVNVDIDFSGRVEHPLIEGEFIEQ